MKDRYFEGISRKSIIVCGIYPPPLGGISVHIQRVIEVLTSAYNKVYFFDIGCLFRRRFFPFYCMKLIGCLLKKRPDQVHFHGTYIRTMIVDLIVLFIFSIILKYELVIVDHDCRHLYKRKSFTLWLYMHIARRIKKVVMIGSSVLQSYKNNQIFPSTYCVESAFLPPVERAEVSIKETYPSSLFIFLTERTPIILINAAHIMIRDSKDIYGLDAAVEMIAQLKNQYPDVGLVVALAEVNDTRYMRLLYQKMRQLDCAEHIYILQNQKELWPLFKQADLFIRPTLSDGSSISIEEALYFNVPVVASTAVERPESVYLYKTEDNKDFVEKVTFVLQEYVYGEKRKRSNLYEKSS
jgi:glycosyltransferase involved in cell wall biosynthesis